MSAMSFHEANSVVSNGSSKGRSVSDPFNIPPDCDEVYPGLYVGDAASAKNKNYLRRLGITHVLNTAEGDNFSQVNTSHSYYHDFPNMKYLGLPLMDLPTTDIAKHFHVAANFINDALNMGGRVLVHCLMGMSRSATCALSFMIIHKGMSRDEALETVRRKRNIISPNTGFLRQLKNLENELKNGTGSF